MPLPDEDAGEMVSPEKEIFLSQEILDDLLVNPEMGKPAQHSTHSGDPDQEAEIIEPVLEFDPQFREEFTGLLYLGALTKVFTWAGHTFKIKTLTSGEMLEVALAHKGYIGTIGDSRAYVTALVAACTISVDNTPLPRPISMDPADTEFSNKFAYVRDSWFPWVVDAVYEQYNILQSVVEDVLEAMGKAVPSGNSIIG